MKRDTWFEVVIVAFVVTGVLLAGLTGWQMQILTRNIPPIFSIALLPSWIYTTDLAYTIVLTFLGIILLPLRIPWRRANHRIVDGFWEFSSLPLYSFLLLGVLMTLLFPLSVANNGQLLTVNSSLFALLDETIIIANSIIYGVWQFVTKDLAERPIVIFIFLFVPGFSIASSLYSIESLTFGVGLQRGLAWTFLPMIMTVVILGLMASISMYRSYLANNPPQNWELY